jgi:chitinase
MAPFASQLRSLMDTETASTGRKFILTAAPQCPYPDVADNDMLSGAVSFDAIFIQFYNNYCGISAFVNGGTQNPDSGFNFATWDNWAKTVSKNPAVKLLIGVPGNTGGGAGYEPASFVANVITYAKTFSSFGGVMIWDMTQAYSNAGFLDSIKSSLGSAVVSTTTSKTVTSTTTSKPNTSTSTSLTITKTTSIPTTMLTSTRTSSTTSAPATTTTAAGTVNQWNQCGGQDWNGGTVCASPYKCVVLSVWYSQCE